jgi:hypothetical protein
MSDVRAWSSSEEDVNEDDDGDDFELVEVETL